MKYSCAIIFFLNGKVLLGHTTGQKHWDLPKGKAEEGETFAEAAVRECKEETGFEVHESELFFMGEVDYQRNKKLVLFFYKPPTKPLVEDLKCTSTYMTKSGRERPELDMFEYVAIEEFDSYLTARMCKSIKEAVQVNVIDWLAERRK